MSTALLTDLTIFILALLVGIEVIGKVPATLHTRWWPFLATSTQRPTLVPCSA